MGYSPFPGDDPDVARIHERDLGGGDVEMPQEPGVDSAASANEPQPRQRQGKDEPLRDSV